jgi:hypothetical protein
MGPAISERDNRIEIADQDARISAAAARTAFTMFW